MDQLWRRFLLVSVPGSFILIAIIIEVLAYTMKEVPLRRHDLDRLVVALESEPVDASIVLLGDSVTQDVLKKYRVAHPGQVANLTTNKASGLVGAMFLLRRYLLKNTAPQHVIIASTPELFSYEPQDKAADIYLTSVFQRDSEKEWLLENMKDLVKKQKVEPAVMNIEEMVWYKIMALISPLVDGLIEGKELPEIMPPLERSLTTVRGIESRVNKPLIVSVHVGTVLRDICADLSKEQAVLHIILAPMPNSVYIQRKRDGEIIRLYKNILNLLSGKCLSIYFVDMNEKRNFPDYAMRDADHLKRPGWTAEYARLLHDYISEINIVDSN